MKQRSMAVLGLALCAGLIWALLGGPWPGRGRDVSPQDASPGDGLPQSEQVVLQGLPGDEVRDPQIVDRDHPRDVEAEAETGVLRGLVVDPSNEGIGGALVRVHAGSATGTAQSDRLFDLRAALDREPDPLAETTASEDGGFRLDALPAGPVTLAVEASGFAPGLLVTAVAPGGEGDPPVRIRLQRAVALSGQVVDDEGRGISGARLTVINTTDAAETLYGRAFAETGSDGSFHLGDVALRHTAQLFAAHPDFVSTAIHVAPGDEDIRLVMGRGATLGVRVVIGAYRSPVVDAVVRATVAMEAGAGSSNAVSMDWGRTDRNGRVEVVLGPGVLNGVTVRRVGFSPGWWFPSLARMRLPGILTGPEDPMLPACGREIEVAFPEPHRLVGTVTDARSGEGLEGARIAALVFPSMVSLRQGAVTDERGGFDLPVSEGEFLLSVRMPGYVHAADEVFVERTEDDAATVRHDVALTRGVVVSGRVADAQGRAVAGARVEASLAGRRFDPADDADLVLGRRGAITDAEGHFILDGVPHLDRLRVSASRAGFADGSSAPFSTKVGQAVRGVDVLLEEGHPVRIEVVDPEGKPVPHARLTLCHGPELALHLWDPLAAPSSISHLLTDSQGVAWQEDAPSGPLTVLARHPDWVDGSVVAELASDGTSPLHVRVVLQDTRTLEGRVLDRDGNPVVDAWVEPPDAGLSIGVFSFSGFATDEKGMFRLENIARTSVILRVRARGFVDREVTVGPDEDHLEIRLRRK